MIVALLGGLLTFGQALPSRSSQELLVVGLCSEFSKAIGVTFDKSQASIERSQLPLNRGYCWIVNVGELTYIINDEVTYVKGFTNGEVERQARRASNQRGTLMLESAIWKRSELILKKIDSRSKLSRWRLNGRLSGPASPNAPALVACNFSETAFGLNSAGVGNFLSVSFDFRTGRVASLTQSQGWKYDKPNVKYDFARAKVVASQLAQRFFKDSSRPTSVVYHYIIPMVNSQEASARRYRSERRIRAGYLVRFKECEILIDAETGKSLGEKRKRK